MKKDTSKPTNILIIKPSALGDVALALPAIASLRSSFPDARITWLVRKEFAPLLRCVEGLDEILLFDRKFLGKCWCNPKAFAALMKFFKELRADRYDLVIDLQGLFRTAFFGWVTGAPRRVGMKTAREFATMFYTQRIPQCVDSAHVIDYYHKIVAAAGATAIVDDYNLGCSPEVRSKVSELLRQNDVETKDYVVLVVGSAHGHKCWPVASFAELADRIAARFDVKLIAVGTRGEKQAIERLSELCASEIINLSGRTDISVLAGILGAAKLVISNDTGPGHIAAAMNAPVVIIFGPTNPLRIRPYKRPHSIVAVDADGRGRAIESTDVRHRIEEVTVDSVFAEVEYHLKDTVRS